MNKYLLVIITIVIGNYLNSQNLEPFEISDEWLTHIQEIAPSKPTTIVKKKRNILVFSLQTGFKHWTIPHTEAVIIKLANKSGAFNVVSSKDINEFTKEQLNEYDAIILNNNCSIRPRRNIFLDILDMNKNFTPEEKNKKAGQLENNLLEYVNNGGGLMVLHGAVTMLNKSRDFSKLVGGSFDYHPKQQMIKVELVNPEHPMVSAFKGEGFEHVDEPYIFNNAYRDFNFRPLLSMSLNKIKGIKEDSKDDISYISWIKKYGKGRVFYCAPSHNPQSYSNPQFLEFLLDGMQYVSGDLKCDDSPMNKPK